MHTIEHFYKNGYQEIPTEKGIYQIIRPNGFAVRFLEQTTAISEFRSKSMLYETKELIKKYAAVQEKDILYIGKAAGRNGLRQRIRQYIEYGYGKGKIHRGGRAIWQIQNAGELLVDFYCCEDCEQEEKRLLKEYKEQNKEYPLANRRL